MNKKNKILLIIATITFLSMVIGSTYAFFQNQGSGSGRIDTSVITGTTDLLSFSFGDLINIHATEENFAKNMGDLSDSTTGIALLRAGDNNNDKYLSFFPFDKTRQNLLWTRS